MCERKGVDNPYQVEPRHNEPALFDVDAVWPNRTTMLISNQFDSEGTLLNRLQGLLACEARIEGIERGYKLSSGCKQQSGARKTHATSFNGFGKRRTGRIAKNGIDRYAQAIEKLSNLFVKRNIGMQKCPMTMIAARMRSCRTDFQTSLLSSVTELLSIVLTL